MQKKRDKDCVSASRRDPVAVLLTTMLCLVTALIITESRFHSSVGGKGVHVLFRCIILYIFNCKLPRSTKNIFFFLAKLVFMFLSMMHTFYFVRLSLVHCIPNTDSAEQECVIIGARPKQRFGNFQDVSPRFDLLNL